MRPVDTTELRVQQTMGAMGRVDAKMATEDVLPTEVAHQQLQNMITFD